MSETSGHLGHLHVPSRADGMAPEERKRWVSYARLLAWLGVGWHGVEAAIAVLAGLAAGSIALVGFGADSVIEALAGFIVIWRFTGVRALSEEAERGAQKLIALSFFLLAAYVGVESVWSLVGREEPATSWVGLGLALVTTITMPLLAWAKAQVGERLGSTATKSEGRQNMLCAYLSVALLVGLGANAFLGWWWADPMTAILIAGVAVKEGWETWQGDPCCDEEGALLKQTAANTTEDVISGSRCCDDGCDYEN
jgi:divalent metal cation (Fe/Co/Zn/Cd) transporter